MSTAPQGTGGLRAQVGLLILKLKERSDWFDNEIKNGGNREYLSARLAECRYITELLIRVESWGKEP